MMVYFIEEQDGDYIKIGASKNPRKRLQQLRGANARKLNIMTVVEIGGYELETLIHRRFKHLRARGEWFEATDELRNFINDLEGVENAGRDMLKKANAFTAKWGIPY